LVIALKYLKIPEAQTYHLQILNRETKQYMDFAIRCVKAREVLDSRGNPTVEVDVITDAGLSRAAVPSGASTGSFEALELRDGDSRYSGKGVLKAVENVKIISKKIIGMDVTKQEEIDSLLLELDGTENKSKLGANAILGISLAVARASAQCLGIPFYKRIADMAGSNTCHLPVPQMNVINSGRHAGIENDIQEHMIMPVKFSSFSDALRAGAEIYHTLKGILKKKFGASAAHLGDEGGFAPPIKSVEARLEILLKSIEESGYKGKVALALDCAASEFYRKGFYTISGRNYSSAELIDFYKGLAETFRIVSIEDGMAEDDWSGWSSLTKELKNIQIVGDDLLVTSTKRIKRAVDEKACNALLLKINQIGTITESINAAKLAFKSQWNIVVSHRSGETSDSSIADIAVGLSGLNANQSKFGAPARGERTEKYNQLLRIEEELGEKAEFSGKGFKI
jgi:enolase